MTQEFKLIFLRGTLEEFKEQHLIGGPYPELVVDVPETAYSMMFNTLQEIAAIQTRQGAPSE